MSFDPSDADYSTGTDDPVQMVNWYHAIAFCNKLSIEEGLTPVYTVIIGNTPVNWNTLTFTIIPTTDDADWNAAIADWSANGYRLPTEAEWQFAARGGNGTHNYTYAGSDTIGDVAWYSANSDSNMHIVGTKNENELGLYDMSGNVWEWIWDWYDLYPATVQTDYRGTISGTDRGIRGGGFDADAFYCDVAYRLLPGSPSYRDYVMGFRVVRP